MRGVIIGFGKIARGHLNAYAHTEGIAIEAIVEPTKEVRHYIKSTNLKLNVYPTIQELFYKEKYDFIDICTPPDTHLAYLVLGLEHNCHVICEKPFLLKTKDFTKLIQLQKLKNKIIYPSHNYKFAPVLLRIQNIVNCNDFGEIVSGHFRTLRSGHAVGTMEWNPNWRRAAQISGGGILCDHGPHSIYIAQWINNKIPKAVSCIIGNLNKDSYTDTEDTALLTIHYSDDIHFKIDLSWAAHYRNTYYAIVGSKESIMVEDDKLTHIQPFGNITMHNIASEFNDASHKSWFQEMFKDFVYTTSTSRRGKKQNDLLNEAFITALIIEYAYISARNGGKKVELPELPDYIIHC